MRGIYLLEGRMERSTDHRRRRRIRRNWQPITPSTDLVTSWVRRANASATRRFGRKLAKYNLIPAEWRALRYMYRAPYEIQWSGCVEIANALGMTKGGGSKLINRLLKKGLVRKLPSSYDRRFRSVGLKRCAIRLVRRLAMWEHYIDVMFFGTLYGKRRKRFMGILKRVVNAYQPHTREARLLERERLFSG